MLNDVSATLEIKGDMKLADDSVGVLPYTDKNGNLQVRRLIESGNAVTKTTAPIASEISDLTIWDQTWRDEDDAIQGVATVGENNI